MDLINPSNWNTLNNDCCTENGVYCDARPRVTDIDWAWYRLNGTLDGTAIPSTLTRLTLNGNKITGPIPTFANGIQWMNLDGNYLSGNLPAFPSSLAGIYLGWIAGPGNHLTGTLSMYQPTNIYINDNLISDVVITSTAYLTDCNLSFNPLLSSPNLLGLSMCTKNGLYLPSVLSTISTDCPNVINLAKGLNLEYQQPSLMTQLQTNCCDSNGIICDNNRKVKYIYWGNMGLNGFLNGSAIPSTTIYIDLYGNQLTGSIPAGLPNNLYYLDLGNNKMSGDLPTFPNSLVTLFLSDFMTTGNLFTGTLRLNRPTDVFISHSYIADMYVNDYSQLNNCDLTYTPLLGNPRVSLFTGCVTTGMYSATLLPNTFVSSTSTKLATSTSKMPTITKMPIATTTLATSLLKFAITSIKSTASTTISTTKQIILTTSTEAATTLLASTDIYTTIYESSIVPILTTSKEDQIHADGPSSIPITSIPILSPQIATTTVTSTQTTSSLDEINNLVLSYFSPIILETSQFRYIMVGVRILITSAILVLVLVQTPFTRELKRYLLGGTNSSKASKASSEQSKFNF